MNRTSVVSTAIAALGLIAAAAIVTAGPIDPPAGPVGSTLKTLSEVEPRIEINSTNTPGDADSLYRISQPGSYYLTGNITGVTGKHGIEIAASGVTIDLNGFDLLGVPGSLDGIVATALVHNIEIRGGTVRQWGGDGIDLLSLTVRGGLVTGTRASSNVGMGIGIGNRFTLTECESGLNLGDGILTGHGCTIARCTAFDNAGSGLATSTGCTVAGSSFYQNTADGLVLGAGSLATECSSSRNTGRGFFATSSATIAQCTALENVQSGIEVEHGCLVRASTARGNGTHGIRVLTECVVLDNFCSDNGDANGASGVYVANSRNRIEGNTCTQAHRGVSVVTGGNIVIRNTCTGNTINWLIASGNVCLIVQGTTTVAPISGNAGGVPPGSLDPNANFTY